MWDVHEAKYIFQKGTKIDPTLNNYQITEQHIL